MGINGWKRIVIQVHRVVAFFGSRRIDNYVINESLRMRWEWTVVFLQCLLINRIAHCLPVNSLLQIDLEKCFPPEGRIWKRPDPVSCGGEQCKFPMFCTVSLNDDNDLECSKVTDACLKIIPINSLLEKIEEKVSPKEKILLLKKKKIAKNANLHKKPVTVSADSNSPSEEDVSVGNASLLDHLPDASTPSSQQARKPADGSDVLVINNATASIPKSMLNNVVSEDNDISREVMDAEVLEPHETVNASSEGSDMGETTLDEGSGQMEFVSGPSVGSATSTEEVNAEAGVNEEQLVALTTRKAEATASVGTVPSKGFHSAESSNNEEKKVTLTTQLPRPTDSATQSTGSNTNVPKLEHCLDGAAFCPFWAMMGECDRNPFWMKPNCQRSCHTCGMTVADVDKIDSPGCQNSHELCQFWKSLKECEKNYSWMSVHCAASCNTCPPKI
ncbi:hypothetical protein M513_01488 [Trichuris suis]|uniref:ShKT domain-containing protein n=1 Tax=Trichuris suis TaxID=68888 RepID=A0A085MKS2_9BILA|nr:hypothetical protein M513_01488 [Trichuris suis]